MGTTDKTVADQAVDLEQTHILKNDHIVKMIPNSESYHQFLQLQTTDKGHTATVNAIE